MNEAVRIILVDRVGSHHNQGGDTVQIHAIANYLTEQGHLVTITGNLGEVNGQADLVIFFNLTIPYELLYQSTFLNPNTPYYVFPIYWDIDKEIPVRAYIGLYKKIAHLVPKSLINIFRWMKFIKLFSHRIPKKDCLRFLFLKKSIKGFLGKAEYICVNSEAERSHLIKKFGLYDIRNKIRVIYNGTDNLIDDDSEMPYSIPFPQYICCIGGIGPRKNQLNLIKAANTTDIPIVIVGQASKGESTYYNKLIQLAGKNIIFLGYIERKYIYHVLKNATAHIQPSFIETPGLVSLEALSIGCRIGVSNVEPVKEYFGDSALYCDPHSIDSIRACLYELWNQHNNEEKTSFQSEYVRCTFNWDIVLKPFGEIVLQTIEDGAVKNA